MGKNNKNTRQKKVPQILSVPAEAIVDSNANNDAVKAKNNKVENSSPSKYKNFKGERSRRASKKGKSFKTKGHSTRDDKKLKLPSPNDNAVQILDGANDFAAYTGALTEYAASKLMSRNLVESLNLVQDPNNADNLVFPDYMPVRPELNRDKTYDVHLEAKVATQSQLQALANNGTINPGLATAAGSSSSSSTSSKPTRGKAATVDPIDPDDDMSNFEAIVVDDEVLLVPRQKRFVVKRMSGAEIERLGISCKEYADDLEKHKKDIEAYEKEVLKVNSEIPSLAQKMWKLISKESQEKIAKEMKCELENVKSVIKFVQIRDLIRDTHHPQFHNASPNTREYYASIESFATAEIQTAKLLMTPKETLAVYKTRINVLMRRLKTAAAIGVRATAAGHIGFVMPSQATLVQRIINSINSVSAPKAFELCSAYRGDLLHFSPAVPATVDALFEELEKAQARSETKQIARQKKNAESKKFLANVHANFGEFPIPEITSMFTAGQGNKRGRGGKLAVGRDGKPNVGKDGKPYPRADIKEALRVQIDPAKLDKKSAKYIFDAIKKNNPEFATEDNSRDDKKAPPKKKFKKHDGRQQGKVVNAHHSTVSDSSDATQSSAEEGDDDDDDSDDDDSDLEEVLTNFNLAPSNLYHTLMALEIPYMSESDLVLLGLRDKRVKETKRRINYSKERFGRIEKFRNTKLSVSLEGSVVHDSGSGIHIIRDSKLLIKDSIRKISRGSRLKVQGTFPGTHVPKYFAIHKLLGFCIFDPQSKANIISQSQAWASGWLYHTDNNRRQVFMSHPSHPDDTYKFEVGRENVLTGIDAVSFDTWDPTYSAKPTSVLSTFIRESVLKNKLPQSLSHDDLQFSEEEMLAFAFPTMTDHHGRRCSCARHN